MKTASQDLAFWGWLSSGPAVMFAGLLALACLTVLGVSLSRRYLPDLRSTFSLRWELALAFSLVAMLAWLVGVGALTSESKRKQQDLASAELAEQARALADNLDQLAQRHLHALQNLADVISVVQPDSRGLAAALAAVRERHASFSVLNVVDHDGTEVAAAGDVNPDGGNVRDQIYFLQPLASGKPYSKLLRSTHAESISLVVSVPVRADTGIRTGVALGWVNLNTVLRSQSPILDADTMLTLLDSRRRVSFSDPPDVDPQRYWRINVGAANVEARDKSRTVGIARTSQGWSVLLQRTGSDTAPVFDMKPSQSWYWLPLVGVAGFLVGWGIARSIVRPLKRLGQNLEDLDAVADEKSVHRPGTQEFQALFQQIAALRNRLRGRFQNLQVSVSQQAKARTALVEQVEAAQSLVQQREQALVQAQEKLEQQSGVDSATGLPTRQAFKQIVGRCWKHAERENEPLTLIAVSLDLFGQYRDLHGQSASQLCLENIGRILRGAAGRPLDRIARCDDAVFGIVLANTSESGGEAIAQRVQSQVEAAAINHKGSRFGIVTVSQGMSVAFPKEGGTAMATWADAHKALQLAKRRGRNSIVVSAIGTVWN